MTHLSIAALFLSIAAVSTQDARHAGTPELALRGLDPVALAEGREVEGRADFEFARGRYAYRFANEASRSRFVADQDRYEIQWGGGCGRMGPLSGSGDVGRFAVHAGRIYIFASDGCRSGFVSAPERFVVEADAPVSFEREQTVRGVALLERARAAHGTMDGGALGCVVLAESTEESGWKREREFVLAGDGRLHLRTRWFSIAEPTRGSDTLWVVGPDSFEVQDGAIFDLLNQDQLLDLRRSAQRELLVLLELCSTRRIAPVHLGSAEFEGAAVENVLVEVDGLRTTLHVDASSGRVRGLSWRGRPDDGATRDVREVFTDYRDVLGRLVPVGRRVYVDGKESKSQARQWDDVRFEAAAPTQAFERATSLAPLVQEER